MSKSQCNQQCSLEHLARGKAYVAHHQELTLMAQPTDAVFICILSSSSKCINTASQLLFL